MSFWLEQAFSSDEGVEQVLQFLHCDFRFISSWNVDDGQAAHSVLLVGVHTIQYTAIVIGKSVVSIIFSYNKVLFLHYLQSWWQSLSSSSCTVILTKSYLFLIYSHRAKSWVFHIYSHRDKDLHLPHLQSSWQSLVSSLSIVIMKKSLASSSSTVIVTKYGVFLIYSHRDKVSRLLPLQSSWKKVLHIPHVQSSW